MKFKINNIVVPDIETAAITAEISKYSITPRSLKERSYDADLKADSCFIEKYKNTEGITAKRFGINLLSSTVLNEVKENLALSSAADSTSASLEAPVHAGAGGSSSATADSNIKLSKSISASSPLAKGDSVKSPPSGPTPSGASSRLKIDISKIIHTDAELVAIEKAILHLFSSPDKAVVIDSFARENGKIKSVSPGAPETTDTEEVPEIHSVVLYKNNTIDGSKEIVVIDPSNFSYTAHLGSTDIVKTLKAQGVTIKTFPKNVLQIYKAPDGNVGPGAEQYRDCIDIAVKLAFGFNASSEWVYIAGPKLSAGILPLTSKKIETAKILYTKGEEKDLDEMAVMVTEKYTGHTKIIRIIPEPTDYEVVSMVSNDKRIDENFTFILTHGSLESARLKQSSEIENQKKFSSILAFIQQNFESIHSIDLSAATSFKSALLGHLGIGGEDE